MRDIDLDQADEFATVQNVELDLFYFNLTAPNFIDTETGVITQYSIEQSSDVEFLNDDFFQNNVTQLDLYFESENTFAQEFTNRISFKNQNKEVYSLEYTVKSGSADNPTTTIFEKTISGDDLLMVKSAISIEVATEIKPNNMPVLGNLGFKSKIRYRLEF
ncbi:MAG: hypothetical protein V7767_14570 [Leeuwenhoekiella sp.]